MAALRADIRREEPVKVGGNRDGDGNWVLVLRLLGREREPYEFGGFSEHAFDSFHSGPAGFGW